MTEHPRWAARQKGDECVYAGEAAEAAIGRRATGLVELMGVAFDAVRAEGVLDSINQGLDARTGGWIVTPNLDILRRISADRKLEVMVGRADIVVADGMPLVWASRLRRTPLPERVAGSDLARTVPELAARRGATVFLLGGNDGTADEAAGRLRRQFPRLNVVGALCPAFGFEADERQLSVIDAAISDARPDIVLVCLGFPKQERLIERLRRAHPDAWYLGLGISLSFLSGDQRRAPAWMQKAGLEWAHRLAQEPRRLARRYLLDGPPFLVRLLGRSLLEGLGSHRKRHSRAPGS